MDKPEALLGMDLKDASIIVQVETLGCKYIVRRVCMAQIGWSLRQPLCLPVSPVIRIYIIHHKLTQASPLPRKRETYLKFDHIMFNIL